MAATGTPEGLSRRKQYTNASSADTTSWSTPAYYANWVQVIGAGSTVVTNEDGSTLTITTDSAEPNTCILGVFTGFTSTTASRVRMGNGTPPEPISPPPTAVAALAGSLGGVQLAGGLGGGGTAGAPVLLVSSPNVSGVLPAANAGDFTDIATINLTSFTATYAAVNAYVFTAGSLTVFFPAITSALQSLAVVNLGTGATAAKLAGNGTAFFVGQGGATAATLTAPASGAALRFFGSPQQNAWIQGL